MKINFALLSDPDCSVLKAVRHVSVGFCIAHCVILQLGCARENLLKGSEWGPSSSGAFLIDLDKRVRSTTRNSLSVG